MQTVARLRNLSDLRNSLAFTTTQLNSFHSTPVCNGKWRKKWNSDFKGGHQLSKNYIRYATRQKRADTKTALRNLSERWSRMMDRTSSWDEEWKDHLDSSTKKGKSKSQSHRAQKAKSKMKANRRKEFFCEDDEHVETLFQATFGDRWYTWSFHSFGGFSAQRSTSGFEWKRKAYSEEEDRYEESEPDPSDEMVNKASSHSHRTILGLPPYGPLKIEDVKYAFRLSALKWHPDKHQGASQAEAEERFKLCVSAYNSLCDCLSYNGFHTGSDAAN